MAGMTDRYRENLVWCELSSCLTGLRNTGTSLNIIGAGYQTFLFFFGQRENVFVALSFASDLAQSWHQVFVKIHYLII